MISQSEKGRERARLLNAFDENLDNQPLFDRISAKLHYTDTGYGHTSPTDRLTTMLQLVVQQICHIAMPEPNIST